jgi:hypothetical protein
VPSKLKEYPAGTTKPTTDLWQPICSNFSINDGNAASEEEVPNTISNSFLMYPKKLPNADFIITQDRSKNQKNEQSHGHVNTKHEFTQGHSM